MATSKYFTVEVKPFIKASYQAAGSAAYADNDVLFDWNSFQVPKGASKLLSITVVMRGKDGGNQAAKDMDFFFAKSINGTAPVTLGNSNATASGAPILANHVIGFTHIEAATDFGGNTLDHFSAAANGGGAAGSHIPSLVLEGEPESGDNVGYDTLYIAATCAEASVSFGTTVLTRGAVTDDTTVTVETDKGGNDDPNADLIFAVGDVIHTATDDVLGTIGSIGAFDTNNQPITFTAPITDDLGDNEELFNVNPLRLILSFEK